MLDRARDYSGVPYIITSGYRCPESNAEISTSDVHPSCVAADIQALNSRMRFLVIKGLLKAGFTRIGIAKTFVHADCSTTQDPKVAWVYN